MFLHDSLPHKVQQGMNMFQHRTKIVFQVQIIAGPKYPIAKIGSECDGTLGSNFRSGDEVLINSSEPDKLLTPRGKKVNVKYGSEVCSKTPSLFPHTHTDPLSRGILRDPNIMFQILVGEMQGSMVDVTLFWPGIYLPCVSIPNFVAYGRLRQ